MSDAPPPALRTRTRCAHEPCGRDFTPKKDGHRFCSAKCRIAWWRSTQTHGTAARVQNAGQRRGGYWLVLWVDEDPQVRIGDEVRISK